METKMIMDAKTKRNMGILCFLPSIAFFICMLYYIVVLSPLIAHRELENHYAINTYTLRNYDTLFVMLAISSVLSAIVLIYCLVHLTRLKNVNGPTKMIWVVVLAALVPVSFIIFWWLHIRHEPREMEVHPDIT